MTMVERWRMLAESAIQRFWFHLAHPVPGVVSYHGGERKTGGYDDGGGRIGCLAVSAISVNQSTEAPQISAAPLPAFRGTSARKGKMVGYVM